MRYTFDSREVRPGDGFVALKGEKADGHDFISKALESGAVEIIDGLKELQKKAHERRKSLKAKVIGVTGSAGKTTTKELIKAFLSTVGLTYATEGNFNNHIGLPLTIMNAPENADFLVLEMGSNHPGEIAALCDIAEVDVGVVTNVGTAHLEFFKTREGIAQEKGTLLKRAKVGFSSKYDEYLPGEVDTKAQWMEKALSGVLVGEHNVANALLAFAVAEKFGVTRELAKKALKDFMLPGSRWRKVEKWGATFIDDTYNANPDSMIAALNAFKVIPCTGRRIAVLGDMFELGDDALKLHQKVFAHAMKLGLDLVIGVGELSSQCLCHLVYKDLSKLVKRFRVEVSSGDLVLLKASHSMELGTLIVGQST